MLRVGVIGVNNIGRIHAGVYRDDPLADLVAVCDLLPDRAERAAQEFGAAPFTSVKEMLTRQRLDLVSVATAGVENGSHHYEPVMEAIAAGVAVLCEKPLSNDIAKAREMVRFAREQRVYLGVDLNHRFVPVAERARELVNQGALGDLLLINMQLWIKNPNETSPWFHLRALHPHSIDVMRYFCGDVGRVQAFCTKPSTRQTWSTASINMQFRNGAVGHLIGSYDMTTRHPFERCEVAGTQGRFVIDNVYESLTYYPHETDDVVRISNSIMSGMSGFRDTFKNRIHRFLEDVDRRAPFDQVAGSGEDGLAAQEVIEAAILSFESGTIVEVPS